jgi:hypothetical protein
MKRATRFPELGAFASSSLQRVRRRFSGLFGGSVGYFATFILPLALLASFAVPGTTIVTFFKVFISFALFVCLAVAVLHFFGRLVVGLFGILDGRAARPNDRYARD